MRIPEDLEPDQCAFMRHSDIDDPCRRQGVYRYILKRSSENPSMWWASPGFQTQKFRVVGQVVACEEHRLDNKDVHPHLREPIEKWVSKIETIMANPKLRHNEPLYAGM